MTLIEFINKAVKIHGNTYSYDNVLYKNANTKVCIICPIHGEFWQTPHNHLQGHGCPKCGRIAAINKYKTNSDDFIQRANTLHKYKYDYGKMNYVNNKTKICIICPIHGEFYQTPDSHLRGNGCPRCAGNNKNDVHEFINRSIKIHGNKYDYSKAEYINCDTKICIVCPIHGEFWQTPYNHIMKKCGCPKCNMSHLENETENILKQYNIQYETQKNFPWLISCNNRHMPLDFFLPEYNVAIECQGIQHYKNNGFFTTDIVNENKQRDKYKKCICKQHGLRVFYVKYNENVETSINNIVNELNGEWARKD